MINALYSSEVLKLERRVTREMMPQVLKTTAFSHSFILIYYELFLFLCLIQIYEMDTKVSFYL